VNAEIGAKVSAGGAAARLVFRSRIALRSIRTTGVTFYLTIVSDTVTA
jgi:hypothetical protein